MSSKKTNTDDTKRAKRRKASNGRVLRQNEYERADGRFQFNFVDNTGKSRCIYAKTLAELREKEKEVSKKLSEGLDTYSKGAKHTLREQLENYLGTKKLVLRKTSYSSYLKEFMLICNEPEMRLPIMEITTSTLKNMYIRLAVEKGYSYNTLSNLKTHLFHPGLELAVQDNILRRNPADFPLSQAIVKEVKDRRALTEEEVNAFFKVLQTNPQYNFYMNLFTVLFETGMRASEICGLSWNDIDLEECLLTINRGLIQMEGKLIFNKPKSSCSNRQIVLSEKAIEALKNQKAIHQIAGLKCSMEIIASKEFVPVKDLVFFTKHWEPLYTNRVSDIYRNIMKRCRDDLGVDFTDTTLHCVRHTRCTTMVNKGMNIKSVQNQMGHSDVETTLKVYAHSSLATVRSEMKRAGLL